MSYSRKVGPPIVAAAITTLVLTNFATVSIVRESAGSRLDLFAEIWPIVLTSAVAVILVMSFLYRTIVDLVHELERNLRLQDVVLKHLTVQVRDDVDVAAVTIDPEEVKFRRLELPAEEEEKISREKQLGLVEAEERRERAPRDEDEYMAGGDEETPESKPNAAGGEEPQA